MLINAFLLFGIDFRQYQNLSKITSCEIGILREKTEKKIQQWNTYGNQVFPDSISFISDEKKIRDCQSRLMDKNTIVLEAIDAEKIVKEYLVDTFGDLSIKKYVKTSDIIISCNELGISLEVFDYYVAYKEIKDRIIKSYPIMSVK